MVGLRRADLEVGVEPGPDGVGAVVLDRERAGCSGGREEGHGDGGAGDEAGLHGVRCAGIGVVVLVRWVDESMSKPEGPDLLLYRLELLNHCP